MSTTTANYANKKGFEGSSEQSELKRIRVTLTSCAVKHLEKACSMLKKGAEERSYEVKGPVRMPTKVLRITTRKSPCGNGTNTWDRFEMRIHKRVVDLSAPTEAVKQIMAIPLHESVKVEVMMI
eukprot:TRINITY_DN391_c0_g2_i1.p1 TRINITY_DN391_c0_g2~~TRINITY_DN391_c0_g2_i1.p1  ORF type:complete len:124 (-),score=31.57 TRINITY_DN391_c0_g2_i1:36-407(-)